MTIIAVYGTDEKSRRVAIALDVLLKGTLPSVRVSFEDRSDNANPARQKELENAIREDLVETDLLNRLDDDLAGLPIEIAYHELPTG